MVAAKKFVPLQLKSWDDRVWIALSLRWGGWAHLGPPVVKPLVLNQSANHAMWQLQLKGLEIRFKCLRETKESKAPGVTQLIRLEYKLSDCSLTSPLKSLPLTSRILFSDKML